MPKTEKKQPADADWVRRTRADASRYWDAHPIGVDSVSFAPGTAESFDALYARLRAGMTERSYAFLEQCRGKRVLEMGCGTAMHGRFLAENGIDYTGVDYSRRSLSLARAHFARHGIRARFVRADGTKLPFADESFDLVFSDGVVHHIPDMPSACREIVRVARSGGAVRVMVYARDSYHYALVKYGVRPAFWLMTRVPALSRLAALGPPKFEALYRIAETEGLDAERLLAASTDTSTEGDANANPLSYFLTEADLRELFPSLEARAFRRTDLKYFPFPPLRGPVERRYGFFLTMTGRRP